MATDAPLQAQSASRADTKAASRWRGRFGDALPGIALAAMLAVCAVLQPAVLTSNGLNLLFSPAVPLALAAISQMFIIVLGDIDLGTGYLVGLASAIAAVHLATRPWLAVLMFVGVVLLYMLAGAIVHIRQIPSIIVTLGGSFIWLGLALLILPTPGGTAPSWLVSFFTLSTPVVPFPLLFAAATAAVAYFLSIRMAYGAVIRGAGSNPQAVARSGWSLLRVRLVCYGLAAVFGILSGIAVAGVTSSGDANASANYTLLAIAAVILGGAEFAGGRAVPVGAVIGALAISLIGSMLALLGVSSDYQTGVQGLVLVAVLAGRVLTTGRI
jgi:ribose transport system permease protein